MECGNVCLSCLTSFSGCAARLLTFEGVFVLGGLVDAPKWYGIMAMWLAAPVEGAAVDRLGGWFSCFGSKELP